MAEGEGNRVEHLAWSPDGRMVAAVVRLPGRGGFPFIMGVKVWDARTGKLLRTLIETQTGFASPVTFSPDSKLVATLVDRKEIKLWDTATGKEKATFEVPDISGQDQCWNLAFSPDGAMLASAGHAGGDAVGFDGYVRVFDAKTGKVLWEQAEAHTDRVWGLAFSPDGKTLASASRDMTAKLWDAAGKLLRTFDHGESGFGPCRVAFSPDGKTLASGGTDGSVRIWNVDTGKLRRSIEYYHKGLMLFVAFSPRDGKTLLIAGYPATVRGGTEEKPALQIRLVDLRAWKAKVLADPAGVRWLRDLAVSPDGKTLAIGGEEGEGEQKDRKMKLILQPVED